MQSDSDEDDSGDEEANDNEVYNMYRDTLLAKGIQTDKHRKMLSSAQSQPNTAKKGDLTLPPIDGHKNKTAAKKKAPQTSKARAPSVVKVPNSRGESRGKKLRTAAQNFHETGNKYPPMQEMLNIQYKDQYNDIF